MRNFVQIAAIFFALFGGRSVAAAEDIGDCPANAVAMDDAGNAIALDSAHAPLRAPDLGELCRDPNDPRCSPANPAPDAPSLASSGDGERFVSVEFPEVPSVETSAIRSSYPEKHAEARGPSGYRDSLDDPPRVH